MSFPFHFWSWEGRESAAARRSGASELDPDALAPVAAPVTGLAPPILVLVVMAPLPIVVVDVEAEFRLVLISVLGSPAVAVVVANDCSGSGRGEQSQPSRERESGDFQSLHGFLLRRSMGRGN